ncbi:MAG: tRNA 2-thiouridine(34) synthase MnmA [Gammaproteobacteria bacterium RIFCSPLOWO2_02_47_7]|jgi:tRNA-specific 2-thiouridylase|nr:MAG: tRNA 2-thiouridine(34) synthase MnmA [Gammaproteobacteria bacterium RIFCSPLOWO2_02_47_7]OGT76240.1 MAG: tRNA 2-thiouridine(34) synthase MnmA [Gammaproteobacteria bacterium RIFCSPLOWO2_12_47_11]
MKKQKVIVGLSGGVDSSVCALLLQEQGYQIEGLFMKNWDERTPAGSCMWEADVEDAMRVCQTLGIPLNTVDLSAAYWTGVFSHFIDEYKSGRTPNPDILCNQEIKFRAFLDHALQLGADRIATGHYARIVQQDGTYHLLKGLDKNKDQSYFLCRLNQEQLARSLFPVGELEKTTVRELAKKAGFITHDKKDSTGICFIGERPFREFLGRYIPRQTGEIRTTDGKTVGTHDGIFYYTLGQRQGLGIGGIQGANEEPWYVVGKDIEKNILYIGQGHDHPLLYSQKLTATNLHWISGQLPAIPFQCSAKTRYRQADQDCVIEQIENRQCEVRFTVPQRAATPGQYIVFYQADTCLGGAIINSTRK